MDLNELKFFVYVCRSCSFTVAAQQLGVPKSTVSRAIRRLELRVGVRLVERTTRSVAITEAGQIYYEHCQRVMEEAEQADLAMGALMAEPRGRLRVAVPSAFARSRLAPILGTFLARYPEVRLELQFTSENPLQKQTNLDVVIRAGRLEDSGLLVSTLAPVRIGVYASPAYLSGRTAPDVPMDLRLHSCITVKCGTSGSLGDATIWKLRRGRK
jgi:DNA-binding transcriptional LysR family regulator